MLYAESGGVKVKFWLWRRNCWRSRSWKWVGVCL